MESVLTASQILSVECRGEMDEDERLRFAREIEAMVMKNLKVKGAMTKSYPVYEKVDIEALCPRCGNTFRVLFDC